MKEQIIQNIHDPEMLEMLFRKDKTAFLRDFSEATNGIESDLVKFWEIRLKNTDQIHQQPAMKNGFVIVAVISVITALLVRLPLFIKSLNLENFYMRNLCVLIFAALASWFIVKNRIRGWKNILLLALPTSGLAIITRLSEGFTPNRTVVFVSNILIMVNLLLVLPDLYLGGFRRKPLDRMERNINRYLPVYFICRIVVIFIFPLIF